MSAFWTTIQIVGGILVPIVIIGVLWLAIEITKLAIEVRQYKIEVLKSKPPFDEVESSMSYEDRALRIRLIKNGEIVYEGSVSETELTK